VLAVAGAGCALLLSGVASAASGLSVSPTTLAFGTSCVGAPIDARAVTMTNTGSDPLTVSGIALTGSHPQDFSLADAQPRTIPPGQSGSFKVGFLPRVAGDRSAIVRITSDAPEGPVEIPVSGRGATRILDVNPEALSFGDQRIKTTSDELALSITSIGGDPVRITGVAAAGTNRSEFTVRGSGAQTLDSGEDAIVTVAFRPGAVGRRTATITIDSDACVGRMTIAVEGNGTAPDIKVNPSPIDLGHVAVGTRSRGVPVVISNGGRAPLRITRIIVEGDAPADFRFESLPSTPKVLGPAGELPLTATFTPGQDGPRTAILRVESDDPDTPVMTIELRGNVGTPSPSPSASETASASPAPTRSAAATPSEEGRTGSGGGAGDWFAVAVVLLAGGGTFGGLFAIARRRSVED